VELNDKTKLVAVVKTRICINNSNERTDQKSQVHGQETVKVNKNQTC